MQPPCDTDSLLLSSWPCFLWKAGQLRPGWMRRGGTMWHLLCPISAHMLNHLILLIILQYKYHLQLHLIDEKTEFREAKQFAPNHTALKSRVWFSHLPGTGAYHLSTCHISSWGRIFHHIPTTCDCFKEAARKERPTKGWLFGVLEKEKSKGDRGYYYLYSLMKSYE